MSATLLSQPVPLCFHLRWENLSVRWGQLLPTSREHPAGLGDSLVINNMHFSSKVSSKASPAALSGPLPKKIAAFSPTTEEVTTQCTGFLHNGTCILKAVCVWEIESDFDFDPGQPLHLHPPTDLRSQMQLHWISALGMEQMKGMTLKRSKGSDGGMVQAPLTTALLFPFHQPEPQEGDKAVSGQVVTDALGSFTPNGIPEIWQAELDYTMLVICLFCLQRLTFCIKIWSENRKFRMFSDLEWCCFLFA